jgi:membrane protease YdiL (CAAX protease family)
MNMASLESMKLQLRDTLAITADRRPGLIWRLLVYLFPALITLAVSQGVMAALGGQRLPFPQTTAGALYLGLGAAWILGITAQCRRFVDRRPWGGIGLARSRRAVRQVLLGWLVGCLLIMLVFAIEYALGWARVEGNEVATSGLGPALDYVLGGLLLMLGVGFTEEVVFRGYVFQNVGEQFPLWFAALVTGCLFAAAHGAQGELYFASAILVSTFLICTRISAGSLWFAIAFHGGWNWMQTSVLGISQVNAPEYGHALVHVSQSGPELFVGAAPMIEGGLIVIGLLLAILMGKWLHSHGTDSAVSWRARLSGTGEPVGPEQPEGAA